MADLYLDAAALEALRANLRQIRDLLNRPARELAAVEGTGPAVLQDRMAKFGEEWSYGFSRMGKLADSADQALAEIERVFRETDLALGQVFVRADDP